MSKNPHPGMHPDADSLSAFAEGVLPEHERLECLAHLAECARCREIVYLAQEPPPAEELRPAPVAADPVPFRKRWFAPLPVLAAAAAFAIVMFSIGTYQVIRSGEHAPEPEPVPGVRQQIATAPAAENAPQAAATLSSPRLQKTVPAAPPRARRKPDSIVALAEIANGAAQPVPAAAAPLSSPPLLPLASPAAPPPPAPPVSPGATSVASVALATPNNSSSELAAVSGTVTDASGGVVTGANVKVRAITGSTSGNARTDAKGQFNVAGLAPGRYDLEFQSPGFKQTSKQVDLQPRESAKVDPSLEIGTAAETVAVLAAAPILRTESAGVAGSGATRAAPIAGAASILPDKLPVVTTAASGKLAIASDANGALFLSRNSGKSWKAVKPAWQGKVVRLVSPPDAPDASNALFQITTDSGSVWLSRDGNHWSPAPTSH